MKAMETIEVYQFDDLDENAKETARDWYRDGALDYEWFETTLSDAADIAATFGLDVRRRSAQLVSGETRKTESIYFRGFSSQGDGACFEGSYKYKKGALAAIKAECPQDKELHRIVADLQAIQRRRFYSLGANTKQQGHYMHEGCMVVDVWQDTDRAETMTDEDEDGIAECLRDFARWIYRRLEEEHDYLLSDEAVDESIRANEYEFDEDGNAA